MATGKVARRTAVGDVAALLDSPEVAALIDTLAPQGRGRKGFGPRMLVGACLVKALFALPTWTRVAALIAEHPGLQAVLGGAPSVWACYRFTVKLRENQPALADCLDRIAESLRRIETARRHESLFVAPLLDALRARGFCAETCAMDKGFDNNRVMDEARERGCVPIVALRKGRPIPLSPIPYGSGEWKRLYRGRAAVERTFGLLKHDYGLAPLRVRGLERVALHTNLTMLARLGQALMRVREMPLAA